MSASRRPSGRRRAGIAAIVTVLCAALGVAGVATGAQAAPALHASTQASVSEVTLGALAIDGNGGLRSSTVGNGGRLVLDGAYGIRWWGAAATPHVSLQRKVGSGRWTTTTAKVAVGAHGLRATTPAFSTAAVERSVAYRFRSAAYSTATNSVKASSLSKTVTIVYENQHRYTGLAKTVYGAVRAYCPATAVHIGSLTDKAGDYRTGALLIRIAGDVRNYLPIDVRAVALHECSHERQWLGYGGTTTGWAAMEAAAATRFADWTKPAGVSTPYVYEAPAASISPVEHAADCGAQAANPGGYLGYGGYCTPSELKAAKRLLLGHRY